eukprot:238772-Amphidinium_carterae.2
MRHIVASHPATRQGRQLAGLPPKHNDITPIIRKYYDISSNIHKDIKLDLLCWRSRCADP